jgi:aspartate racemase
MKKMGLIGGTSWHSTLEYYRSINQQVNDHFHGNTNPPLWIVNLNQQEIHQLQQAGQWDVISDIILQKATQLQEIGIHALALCANTPHKVIENIQPKLRIPFIHIANAVGEIIHRKGWKKVGLLGTRFTMNEDFIKGKLNREFQVETMVPDEPTQLEIQCYIVQEFSYGIFSVEAKQYFLEKIRKFAEEGAEAVILGCTEIPLLLKGLESPLPVIDSMQCHCDKIVHFILEDD